MPSARKSSSDRISRLPILQCWPGDAGRFITYGMVLTQHPQNARRLVLSTSGLQ